MYSLLIKEIKSFLTSIIGYVFTIIFLLTSGLFHWVISYNTNFLEGMESDLIPFFNLSPTIFLILIPAITMKSIAEERKNGTIEVLFTKPISDFEVIMAKYLSSVILLIIALIPTLIYYWSMYSLGNPVGVIDDGATITSYLGLILLGATFISVGIFSSSLTNSQIVAFILAMFFCWFLYDGLNLLGSFNLMGDFDLIIRYLSASYHYESIKKGVVDTSDLIYFLSVITIFVFSSLTVLKSLKK